MPGAVYWLGARFSKTGTPELARTGRIWTNVQSLAGFRRVSRLINRVNLRWEPFSFGGDSDRVVPGRSCKALVISRTSQVRRSETRVEGLLEAGCGRLLTSSVVTLV